MGGYYGIAALAAMMQLAFVFVFALVVAAADSSDDDGAVVGLPNCPTKCGDVSVPYPFGIQPGCYLEGFNLTCNTTHTSPQLYAVDLGPDFLRVTNISSDDNTLRFGGSLPFDAANMTVHGGLQPFEEQLLLKWKVVSTVLRVPNRTQAGNATCPWDLGSTTCHSSYSTCRTSTRPLPDRNNIVGYVCTCNQGYQGNAYLPDGCRGKLLLAIKPCTHACVSSY
jgi:hypothetical protein